MTVRRSLVATLVGRERNSAERIADPAGLATSEYDGVTRNGERQVGIEVMGLDPHQWFTTQRFDIDGSDHLHPPRKSGDAQDIDAETAWRNTTTSGGVIHRFGRSCLRALGFAADRSDDAVLHRDPAA
jgi:hypothetical protein